MLTPQQLAYCADNMITLYAKLEEQIVRDVARRICKATKVTETGIWQVNILQEIGVLQSDILYRLAEYTKISDDTLKDLFGAASIAATAYDNEIYRANGINPKSIKVSAPQMQVIEAGYKKTNGNLYNLARTTAVTSQTSFIAACSLAEAKVTSGAFTYTQAITDAIKQIASDGAYVMYPSGHRDRLDVAVRRNVMTGLGQTTGEICLANARELGQDLMEITAHAGARPSHSWWQGKIVSLSGRSGYLSLSDIGYGSGTGFKGWNCRHDWYPYFEGDVRAYTDKDLQELNARNVKYPDGTMHTQYEAEQHQRAYERKIRETKRTLAAYDEGIKTTSSESLKRNLKNDFDKSAVKLKRQESELNNLCEKTGLLIDSSRSQVYGFGKSTAQKAVGYAKRYYKGWSREHNINNIKTLAEYYNVKYNDTKRYRLLKCYANSIDKGMLSPITGFDLYEEYYNRVQNELVGLTTSSGIKIQSQSIHFLERVFGTKEDPKTLNPRNGVSYFDIKDSLINGTEKSHYIKDKNGNRITDDESVSYVNNKCSVSVNPTTGNLIQVQPAKKR